MKELLTQPVSELTKLLKAKKISSLELTQAFLNHTTQTNPQLDSFLFISEKQALEDARIADKHMDSDAHPLCGIPIGIKDIICTKDIRTTAASKILENFIPPYNASVVDHLESVHAVRLGKTNCDEFAMGSSNENSAFADCKNPWDVSRVPGGSSGGSAACVSARQAPVSLGTDTGGSIRQPASLCGIVGLKPTYGRVSRYGVMAFASSLDQVGPFANTVSDCAIVLDAISRSCNRDANYENKPYQFDASHMQQSLSGKTMGVPWSFVEENANKEVLENFQQQIEFYKSLGVEIKNIDFQYQKYASACYYIIAPAEASSNLARYDGIRFTLQKGSDEGLESIYKQSRTQGFGAEVQRRILLGTFVLSAGYYDAYYNKAVALRQLIRKDFEDAFASVDIIATPSTPSAAFELGSKTKNPLDMYTSDVFTVAVPLSGNPAISIPSGFNERSLPFGIQLIGKHFDEETLFQFGFHHEEHHQFYKKVPPIL